MPQIKQFIACKNAKTATVKPFCEIKNITDTTADLYFYGDTRMQSKISLQKQTAEI